MADEEIWDVERLTCTTLIVHFFPRTVSCKVIIMYHVSCIIAFYQITRCGGGASFFFSFTRYGQ